MKKQQKKQQQISKIAGLKKGLIFVLTFELLLHTIWVLQLNGDMEEINKPLICLLPQKGPLWKLAAQCPAGLYSPRTFACPLVQKIGFDDLSLWRRLNHHQRGYGLPSILQ